MLIIRLPILPVLISCVAAMCLSGCGEHDKSAAEEAPSAPVRPLPKGEVSLGADAPELKQMSIEPVKTVNVPADEIVAPAKIEVNPNQVGHAVLPVPGRVVRVMTKLGDSVKQGQPLLTLESSVIGEAESGYVQAESSVRQAELAVAKAEADLTRMNDLYEHQAIAQKEALAAQTVEALTRASLEQARTSRDQARRRLELLGLKAGQFQQHVTLTAPISGRVLEISVVAGEFRNEINTPLRNDRRSQPRLGDLEVPESKIRFCKIGGTADLELIAYPGETFRPCDADRRHSKQRDPHHKGHCRIGQSRRDVCVPKCSAGCVCRWNRATPWIPAGAVVRIGDKDFVFVEQSPGRFLSTPVELGKPYDGGFSVVTGSNRATGWSRRVHLPQSGALTHAPKDDLLRCSSAALYFSAAGAVHRRGHLRIPHAADRGVSRRHRHSGHGGDSVSRARAEEVEKQVTIPLEIAVSGIPHSVRVFSHTQYGLSSTYITFDDEVDNYFARQQVLERLQYAWTCRRAFIPTGALIEPDRRDLSRLSQIRHIRRHGTADNRGLGRRAQSENGSRRSRRSQPRRLHQAIPGRARPDQAEVARHHACSRCSRRWSAAT